MEAEPRTAKQYKCHHCCSCKSYWGKGMEGGKKCFASFFGRPKDRKFVEKNNFWASCSTSNKLLLVARHILTTGLQKRPVKFSNLLSLPSTVKRVCTGNKSTKGLKRCWAKVKGTNNPA